MTTIERSVGAGVRRLDGPDKVRGRAPYAYEHELDAQAVFVAIVQSPVARGRITAIDGSGAQAVPGVLAVLTHVDAPRLGEVVEELRVLQSDAVQYAGQPVAVVVAETSEVARDAVGRVRVEYESGDPDVVLSADRDDLYAPEKLMAGFETDSVIGDVDAALAEAPVSVDVVYETPNQHNNPIEMHATVARWDGDVLRMWDANQGPHNLVPVITEAFGITEDQLHITSPYVGGAFGSKAFTHVHQLLAIMAAKVTGRTAKLELTRQQMFSLVGHRTPTIQRLRLGARPDGTLTAISHEVVEHTSQNAEFAEQTATATRLMYAAPARRTTHRLARLDVPAPTIMRAPGEAPGMYALESAMDELAAALGMDPVQLRLRNEPDRDPERDVPWSTRNLVACLTEGAERFGWAGRDHRPGVREEGRWLVGTGVAAATYPTRRRPSQARIEAVPGKPFVVSIDASDIGTGAWTTLTQIAADALRVPMDQVVLRIGDSRLPKASGAGGSTGITSWGPAVVDAAEQLRDRDVPAGGLTVTGSSGPGDEAEQLSSHAFGAHFAEVRVDRDTGEVRVPRMTGVFAAGRIINPVTARSQFLGGMTMGLSMALHEEAVLDTRRGHYANHDLAEYHIAANADVGEVDIAWVDEVDEAHNPLGAKGIGEIGIVGSAAAIGNAYWHATGRRVRDLPITPDKWFR
ncbi:xanthine dehydrogenase family protein molybdopterin-binding subunit [Klenkia taihuensis]|uniref:Xanthine dehydrogenase YagR molybdenum-binding subunit n=1 Tax=Klenkia taihuensis TaxID=1225127 RepID=A0A1I1UL61_9ACTN|nr:xanthine dehydrogenase family protein molybdopterin-binding subunit [Klenkia taihuensis]GHE14007.1 xanthine dehydrogenase [Klenkia taihuensis]SFD71497.1 xanthine dehydrogenase YagR molybdenum-binding subunit [Klenkia taihuensis]